MHKIKTEGIFLALLSERIQRQKLTKFYAPLSAATGKLIPQHLAWLQFQSKNGRSMINFYYRD